MADTVSSKSTNDDHNTTMVGTEKFTQDTNTDERLSGANADHHGVTFMNLKRTYDLHQTLDTEAIINARRLQNSEAEMRMRHAEEEHKQKLRHEEDMHTVRVQTLTAGSVGTSSIIRDIADATAAEIVVHARAKLAK